MTGKLVIKLNHITIIAGINILLFLVISVLAFLGSQVTTFDFQSSYSVFLYRFGAADLFSVLGQLEIGRLITANYLHGDIIHLALNMYSFFIVAPIIYRFYGGRYFFFIYTFTGIVSSLSIFFMQSGTVGASGAIFGLLGVIVALTRRRNFIAGYGQLDINRLMFPIFAILAFGFLIPESGINNIAHIFGFIAGIALGYLITPRIGEIKIKNDGLVEQSLYSFAVIATVLAFTQVIFFL